MIVFLFKDKFEIFDIFLKKTEYNLLYQQKFTRWLNCFDVKSKNFQMPLQRIFMQHLACSATVCEGQFLEDLFHYYGWSKFAPVYILIKFYRCRITYRYMGTFGWSSLEPAITLLLLLLPSYGPLAVRNEL